MFTKSLWNAYSNPHDYPTLKEDIEADVAIIGAGATGLALAAELKGKGYRIAVLEALKVGGGTTAHSTGNLYHTIDKHFADLVSKYDAATLKRLLASRAEALSKMTGYIHQFKLDCDLVECDWYKFTSSEDLVKDLEKELQLGTENSAGVSQADISEIPIQALYGIKVKDQYQLNPMLYAQSLAQAVNGGDVTIYENSRVHTLEKENDCHLLRTDSGSVKAKYMVHATHVPKGIMFVQTLLGPYREYGIACKTDSPIPKGIFWGFLEKQQKISFRSYERNGEKYLILVGKPHKVGQEPDTQSRIHALETFARENFKINEVTYRWGGQHYRPADLLPYIGAASGEENSFIATGYSTDGLVWGTLAAMIITDLIQGKTNAYADLYDPVKRQPLKSVKNFLKENLNVVKQFKNNLPFVADVNEFDEIKNEEGKVVDQKGKKIAAYRDGKGTLHVTSAVCTHMGCIVNWNNAEKTWDCPCHGSRFDCFGSVLEGPAYDPLDPVKEK